MTVRPIRLLVLLAALLPLGLEAQFAASLEQGPVMHPRDRVQVVIWRNDELSGVFTIAADGTLLHPLFSDVRVAGVPIPEARSRMLEFLQRYQEDPQFLFEPQYRVYIGGEVANQGEYFLPVTTLGNAITLAGGSTAPDNRQRVRFIRDGVQTIAALDGQSETELLQVELRSGDQIFLEQRPTFVGRYLNPTLQILQTVTTFVATYVYLNAFLAD